MRCLAHLSIMDLADAMEESRVRHAVPHPARAMRRANDDACAGSDGFGIDAVRFLDVDADR